MIPNLVFKIEAFERDIIKLGKRCNLDLFGDKYPKISTCRDFRLKEITAEESSDGSHLKSQTRQAEPTADTNSSDGTSDSDDVSDY